VPSQKGLVALPPQRHSRACETRQTMRPVPLSTSMAPRSCSGPLGSGSMSMRPSRRSGRSVGWPSRPVSGSPVASKWMSWWLPSQKGLFLLAPQRHSVARVPMA
jgi:hypothetical protein